MTTVVENFQQNGFNQFKNANSIITTTSINSCSSNKNNDGDDETTIEELSSKLSEAKFFTKFNSMVSRKNSLQNVKAIRANVFTPSFLKEINAEHLPSMNINDIMKMKIKDDCIEEEPFYIVDLGILTQKLEQWKTLLPRVEPFYAVKCCPDSVILKTLARFGIGFDCASKGEIQQVIELGVPRDNIIMANPCKGPSHVLKAKEYGVKKMTFDNFDELEKIHKYFPDAELVLRILPDDSRSIMRFGTKFGASPSICKNLLLQAKDLGLNVIGVSFHVGSGCLDPTAFADAVKLARTIFDEAEDIGYNFSLLDIGGGFPGVDDLDIPINFPNIAKIMGPVIDQFFPANVRVIAEPGRYFAAATHSLAVSVFARRKVDLENTPADLSAAPNFLYYVNDGVYGSFNCIFFDHAHPMPKLLFEKPTNSRLFSSKIFGPTCDSLDVVVKEILLPKLEVGDWIVFPYMGAYTSAAASEFNGFRKTQKYYVCTLEL